MIKYSLVCAHSHEFEAWFSKSSDFDEQASKGFIECPICGSVEVVKAIMAPNVATSRKKEETAHQQEKAMKMVNEVAAKIRREIEKNCEYVGGKFADEARAIHYGEKVERAIYGEATPREAAALIDEGVQVAPLPEILSPKTKKSLN